MAVTDTLRTARDGARVLAGIEPWPLVRKVRKQRLSYLDRQALADLYEAVKGAERRDVPGVLVEAGSALGGSAIVMAAAKDPRRPLLVCDAFGMIPEPSDRDGEDVQNRYQRIASGKATGLGGDPYYGYDPDLMGTVRHNFAAMGYPVDEHTVQLVPGLFEDTMPTITGPVAVAHVDGDWYSSTYTCLEHLAPLLSPGGRIVIDDYDHWSGCRDAVDDYLRSHPSLTVQRHARLHLVRR